MKRFTISLTGLILLVVLATTAQAVIIETVPMGNPGNAADMRYNRSDRPEGYGSVNYDYSIGKYEVTAGQYRAFLNAVAAEDPYGLYSSGMRSSNYTSMLADGNGNIGCQITRHGTSGNFTYDFSGRHIGSEADWANRPVNYVDWADAARFANWLHNGQGNGDTEDGVYDLSATHPFYDSNGHVTDFGGYNRSLLAVTRKPGATWAIPTEDEWYKAAYHKNDGMTGNYFYYPTSSDSMPSNDLVEPIDPGNNATFLSDGRTLGREYEKTEVGAHENSESPYGTFDQGGNVKEWTEARVGSAGFGMRGGAFDERDRNLSVYSRRYSAAPFHKAYDLGFRVVSIPELPTDVSIDIKPGSDTNSINLGSNGNIPVAIFGTDTFDVETVDLTTILLAGAGVLERGKNGDLMASFEDINLDGLLDLLVHIDTQALVLSDGDVEALLTGETFGGVSISGTDAIRIVGSSGGQHPATFNGEDAPLLALSAVPEPGSITLLLCGLVSLLCWRRRS